MLQARRLSQALEDIGDLAASDNVDTFVISYNSLLQVQFPSSGHDIVLVSSAFSFALLAQQGIIS